MDKFGLIGHPISHSKSPEVFGLCYAGKWQYDLIETSDFEQAWERFVKEYKAINVTAPFKEPAFRKADIITPEVEMIKATNLLVKTPEGIKAYNSDFRGLVECLKSHGFEDGQTALVVGAGGAGKAAAAAAKSIGMEVRITNRTLSKAEDLAAQLDIEVHPFEGSTAADLMLYTIPGAIDGAERFDCGTIFEAAYANPFFSRDDLSRKGTKYISGAEWHYHQAIAGYALMTGEEPDALAALKAYNF